VLCFWVAALKNEKIVFAGGLTGAFPLLFFVCVCFRGDGVGEAVSASVTSFWLGRFVAACPSSSPSSDDSVTTFLRPRLLSCTMPSKHIYSAQ